MLSDSGLTRPERSRDRRAVVRGVPASHFDWLKPFGGPIDWLRVVSEVEPLRP